MLMAEDKIVTMPMEQLIQVVQLQLSEKGSAGLVVTGNSMWPTFRHRKDQVVLRPADTFQKGDIILYRRENGQYVLHRIMQKKDGYVFCCGDNQWEKERVENSWVLAVVTAFYRKGKHYSVTAKGYRLYQWAWGMLFPTRRPILAVAKKLLGLRKKLQGGNRK